MRRLGRRREGGAAAVEAAIVTPFFIMLIIGIMEFALFFQDNLGASNVVKAGVRMASAEARNSNYAQDAADRVRDEGGAINKNNVQQLWVYKANLTDDYPLGFSNFSNCTTCVKFTWNGSRFVAQTPSPTWAASTMNACAAGPPDRVGVYMQLKHDGLTRLVFTSITIRESSVIRLEPIPVTNGCRP
jgi:Flp pilus assembly protein TadG